jgi:hypothetical protein
MPVYPGARRITGIPEVSRRNVRNADKPTETTDENN